MSKGAIIGIVIAIVAVLGLGFIGIVAAIAVPSFVRARAAANESAAIGSLRVIASAEATYQAEHDAFGTLSDLASAGLLDEELRDGAVVHSYRFREVTVTPTTFEVSAEPTDDLTAGERAYNVTDDLVIRYSQGKTAPRGTSGRVLGVE